MFVLASLIVALLASSAAPTPLYASYQARWHFTPITTTVVFGVYAVAVPVALLTFGKLSDHVGRRPVLLTAIAVHAGSLVIFATATGVPALLSARVVQGLSTGAALGAIGAAMLDMDRELGTFANAVAPGMGSASGAIASALAVRFLPDPAHLIYLALIGVLALQAGAIAAMRETVTRGAGRAGQPAAGDHPAAGAAGPGADRRARAVRGLGAGRAVRRARPGAGARPDRLERGGAGRHEPVRAGRLGRRRATVALRRAAARTVMLFGILALITGVAVTVTAVSVGSVAVFFAGSAIAGAGFGSGFQGGIRLVVPLAAPHERAGLVSLLYVVSYLGLGVPAVLAGFGVVHGGGLLDTARYYGAAVIALAAAALLGLVKTRPGRAAEPAGPGAYDSRQGCLGRWPSPMAVEEDEHGPAVGARAAAGRGQRAVLQRGRAHGRDRPHHRAGRRGQSLAVQHVRQQGRAGPGLPGDPPRPASPSRITAGRGPATTPRGERPADRRWLGQGELWPSRTTGYAFARPARSPIPATWSSRPPRATATGCARC